MQKIIKLRTEIDDIDQKIMKLLAKRRQLALKIGNFKKIYGLKIQDRKREHEILDSRIKKGRLLSIPSKLIKSLFEEIFADSRRLQKLNSSHFDNKPKN